MIRFNRIIIQMPNKKSIIPPDFRKNQKLAAERYNRELEDALGRISVKVVEKRRNLRQRRQKMQALFQVVEELNPFFLPLQQDQQQQQQDQQQQDQRQQDQLPHAFDLRLDQRTREFIDFKSGRSE